MMRNEPRETLPIKIRPADDMDAPFIFSAWLKSYAGQNKNLDRKIVYEYEDDLVRELLETSITLVAAGNSFASAGDIYGFLTAERSPNHLTAHYCYVKAPMRQFGVAQALLDAFDYKPGELIVHTYQGYICKELRKKGFNLMYMPYLRDPSLRDRWREFYDNHKADFKGR